MKTIIKTLSFRNLTIMRKLMVIKSLIISQLMYLLQCLLTPISDISQVNRKPSVYVFVEQGPDKIKRSVIITLKCKGGLDMLHIPSLALAVKNSWIKRLLTVDLKKGWRQIVHYEFNKLTPIIFECNLHTKDIKSMKMDINTFWKEILYFWCQVHYQTPLYGSDFINLPYIHSSSSKYKHEILQIPVHNITSVN